jgi:hypothetical protein
VCETPAEDVGGIGRAIGRLRNLVTEAAFGAGWRYGEGSGCVLRGMSRAGNTIPGAHPFWVCASPIIQWYVFNFNTTSLRFSHNVLPLVTKVIPVLSRFIVVPHLIDVPV